MATNSRVSISVSDLSLSTKTDPEIAHIAIPVTSRTRSNQLPDHPGFELAWPYYLKKTKKKAARAAWNKARPEVTKVINSLKWQFKQPDWIKENHRFAPDFATYLNGERWEDEQPPSLRLVTSAPLFKRPLSVYEQLVAEADAKRKARGDQ